MPWAGQLWVSSILSSLLPCAILCLPKSLESNFGINIEGLEWDVHLSAKGLQTQVLPQVFGALFSHRGHSTGLGSYWSCGQRDIWNSAQRDQRTFSYEALLEQETASVQTGELWSQTTYSNARIIKPCISVYYARGKTTSPLLYTGQHYYEYLAMKGQTRKDHKNSYMSPTGTVVVT